MFSYPVPRKTAEIADASGSRREGPAEKTKKSCKTTRMLRKNWFPRYRTANRLATRNGTAPEARYARQREHIPAPGAAPPAQKLAPKSALTRGKTTPRRPPVRKDPKNPEEIAIGVLEKFEIPAKTPFFPRPTRSRRIENPSRKTPQRMSGMQDPMNQKRSVDDRWSLTTNDQRKTSNDKRVP